MNENLFQSLLLFKKSFHSLINEQCQKFNLTGGELFLLGILSKEGDLHQIEIAKHLDCDKAHVHRLTCKLMDKNLIALIDCHHGKNQKVHLTEEGQKITNSMDEIVSSVTKIVYKDVLPEELNTTKQTIEKLGKNILEWKNKEKNNV